MEKNIVFNLRVMLVAVLVTFVGAAAADHKSGHAIQERTAPTGKVFKEGDDVPVAVAAVVETSGPRDGVAIYDQKCAMCHGAGIAGAPKMGDTAAWTVRMSQGEAVLIDHAINGFQGSTGIMPAKGGCSDCSDDEIKAAVIHMLAALE